MLTHRATVILPGAASGRLLRLQGPISFWGGVDPADGMLTDRTSSGFGAGIVGRVLMAPATRGSSSSSAVLLELLHRGIAPAAIVLGAVDAIVGLGILVAGEMGWPTIPLVVLDPGLQAAFTNGRMIRLEPDGQLVELLSDPDGV